ncbi:MAG: sulfatase/phosphatase domain-containing protein, partial [Candidatus Binatia bacterium]
VVTADHGEELLDHGQVGHASTTYDSTLFEELIRIPMIVVVPGWRAGAGAVIAAPVQLHDLMPTLLELAGVPRGDSAPEAISLVPLVERGEGGRRTIFASGAPCGYNCDEERWDDRIHVASDLRWKLLRFAPASGPTREVLFVLSEDPSERRPLAADRPEARELRDALDAALGQSRELRARIGEPLRFAAPTPKPAADVRLSPGGPPNPNPN